MTRSILYHSSHLLNPQDHRRWALVVDGALVVSEQGLIAFAGSYAAAQEQFPTAVVVELGQAVLMPGLVDTHVHLPQYPAAGLGRGELLTWLETIIFPLEAQFADPEFAQAQSEQFFRDALAVGTTTMSVYCSSHYQATDIAFAAALAAGLRVCMGKTMMDCHAPLPLLSSATENIEQSLELAHRWHGAGGGRLQYTLTPRFAGCCSGKLMQRCGEVGAVEGLRIQTHIAENPEELNLIASLFPEALSYADIYARYNLLTERTILAHAIYLNAAELQQLQATHCAIAHCPTSNRFLQSGVMPLRQYLETDLRIGLGCDVAGGYSLSLLAEAREACESSKTWNLMHRGAEQPPVTPTEALWLATLGGAEALGMAEQIGSLDIGKSADFLVLDWSMLRPQESPIADLTDLVARFVYTTTGVNPVRQTFVQGQQVSGIKVPHGVER